MEDGRSTEVLVAGAGPTGLVLALGLAIRGIRVRIVDPTDGPGTTSRAVAVQARTLELYRPMGLAGEIAARGRRLSAGNFWVNGRRAARAAFGEMGAGLSPYPYVLMFPQDEHESVLVDRLEGLGIAVERRTTLVGCDLASAGDDIAVTLKRPDGSLEVTRAHYLAGCDGAHSFVRHAVGAAFSGGTYEHLFYVADVEADGPVMDGELHVALDDADFLAVFPLPGARRARLIGAVREDTSVAREPGWDDIGKSILRRLRIEVARVNWFSTYRVHHRVAERFRAGRAFLLGDAAHVHSPVGGQGMNTGIGDAINLAWKLASVLRSGAPDELLDSYEVERLAFARRLVATTDRMFQFVTRSGRLAALVRRGAAPTVLASAFTFGPVRRALFRLVSQIDVHYRESALSEGRAGRIRGGDRLPWVPDPSGAGSGDNFEPGAALGWRAHAYGHATPALRSACASLDLALDVFPWSLGAERAGFERQALYLVRPDGYVALADPEARPTELERYLRTRRLAPEHGSGARILPPDQPNVGRSTGPKSAA